MFVPIHAYLTHQAAMRSATWAINSVETSQFVADSRHGFGGQKCVDSVIQWRNRLTCRAHGAAAHKQWGPQIHEIIFFCRFDT